MVDGFLQENPGADGAALVAAFGTPEEFAVQMLATLEPEEIDAARRRRELITKSLIALVAFALTLTATIFFVKWWHAQSVINGDFYVIQVPGHNITEEEYNSITQATQGGE